MAGYISIYKEPKYDESRRFSGFTVVMNANRFAYGYWTFLEEGGNGDDFRAYQKGLYKPEMILMMALKGEDMNKDIRLRWVAGEKDTYQKAREGAAEEHITRIQQETKLLGLPRNRHSLPQYYHDPDKQLLYHRERPQPPKHRPALMRDRLEQLAQEDPSIAHWGYAKKKDVIEKLTKQAESTVPPKTYEEFWKSHTIQSTITSPSTIQSSLGSRNTHNVASTSHVALLQRESRNEPINIDDDEDIPANQSNSVSCSNFSSALYSSLQQSGVLSKGTSNSRKSRTLIDLTAMDETENSTAQETTLAKPFRSRGHKNTPQTTPECSTTSSTTDSQMNPPSLLNQNNIDAAPNFFPVEPRNQVENAKKNVVAILSQLPIKCVDHNDPPGQPGSLQQLRGFSSSNQTTEHIATIHGSLEQTTKATQPLETLDLQKQTSPITSDKVATENEEVLQCLSPLILNQTVGMGDAQNGLLGDFIAPEEPLRCLDCYEIEPIHKDNCQRDVMQKINPGMLPASELLNRMTELPEHVRRYTAISPDPEPESLEETTSAFAHIIRNEESYNKDPDLKNLSDNSLVMAWAFKEAGATVIYPNGEISNTMFDHEWDAEAAATVEAVATTQPTTDTQPKEANTCQGSEDSGDTMQESWESFIHTWDDPNKDVLNTLTKKDVARLGKLLPELQNHVPNECEYCDGLMQSAILGQYSRGNEQEKESEPEHTS